MATITEIAESVYRINIVLPGRSVTFSLFLIDDDLPTLVETSFGRVFDEVRDAVSKVLDPRKLRHIVVPHLEGDECGSLNKFLEIAPDAVPVCSPIGVSSIGLRGSTNFTSNPLSSRTWNKGIQYTPVDSIATVSTPQPSSQSAKR